MISFPNYPRTDIRFQPFRPPIAIFFQPTMNVLTPGYVICVDKLMSMWYGWGKWHPSGMSHVAKIIRKVRGGGIYMKCACNGLLKMALQIETCESADAIGQKQFKSNDCEKSTTTSLRLIKAWRMT